MAKNTKARILIIDDSALIVNILRDILITEYEVHTVNDFQDSINIVKQVNPHLILLDIVMPKISGFEIIKMIKKDPMIYDIPIIFISGLKETVNESKAFELGAVDFITKPFHPSIVKARVKTHIQLYLYRKQIEGLAWSDGLTGLYNRRGYEFYIKKSWTKAKREKKPLSLMMIDIDCFKLYNDTYGHLQGDEVLKVIAESIVQGIDDTEGNIAVRYGGEEFLIILPDVQKDDAIKIAQNIFDNIKALRIIHESSKVAKYVTVSLGGVTIIPDEKTSITSVLNMADQMLYIAKKNGRNKIEWE